jgi:hypothetical protein
MRIGFRSSNKRIGKNLFYYMIPAVLVDLLLLDDLLEELEVRHVTAAPHHRTVVHLYNAAL